MATNPNPLSLLAVLLDFILQNLYNKTMIKIYKCKRCKHEWAGRLPRAPKVCPGCNSPYWNKKKWKGVKNEILRNQIKP